MISCDLFLRPCLFARTHTSSLVDHIVFSLVLRGYCLAITILYAPLRYRFHTDPSGTFTKYGAYAIGSGSEGAQTALQEGYRYILQSTIIQQRPAARMACCACSLRRIQSTAFAQTKLSSQVSR